MARNFLTRLVLPASQTGAATFNIPHGTAPSSPVNGDVWTTTAGLYVRVNGTTVGPLNTNGPATTVTTLTGLQSAVVGTSTLYARGDHQHAVADVVDLTTAQSVTGQKTFTRNSDSTTALIAKRNSSSTLGNLLETQDQSSNPLLYVDGTGYLYAQYGAFVRPASTGAIGLNVRALASQTGDLQNWQSSASAVLAAVTKDGNAKLGSSRVWLADAGGTPSTYNGPAVAGVGLTGDSTGAWRVWSHNGTTPTLVLSGAATNVTTWASLNMLAGAQANNGFGGAQTFKLTTAGLISLGAGSNPSIHASANGFAGAQPIAEIYKDTSAGGFSLLAIRGAIGSGAVERATGIMLSMSSEADAGESNKSWSLSAYSAAAWSNGPSFILRSHALNKNMISVDGTSGVITMDDDVVVTGALSVAGSDVAGAWTSGTLTTSNITSAAGTIYYKKIGKTLHIRLAFTGGTATAAAAIGFTLPTGTAHGTGRQMIASHGTAQAFYIAAGGTTFTSYGSFGAGANLTGYTAQGTVQLA